MSRSGNRRGKLVYVEHKFRPVSDQTEHEDARASVLHSILEDTETPVCAMPCGNGQTCVLPSGHNYKCSPPAEPRQEPKPKKHKWMHMSDCDMCSNCGWVRRIADTVIASQAKKYDYWLIKNGMFLDRTTKAPKCV